MTQPLKRLPNRFDNAALVDVLAEIGLPLPSGAKLHASQGKQLGTVGVLFASAKVDEALGKTELSNAEKMTVKFAIINAGLMGK